MEEGGRWYVCTDYSLKGMFDLVSPILEHVQQYSGIVIIYTLWWSISNQNLFPCLSSPPPLLRVPAGDAVSRPHSAAVANQ